MAQKIDTIVRDLHVSLSALHQKIRTPQTIEVLLLVDNSGSMSWVQEDLLEAVVSGGCIQSLSTTLTSGCVQTVTMEALRRLELRFAIARFGKHSDGVRLLKNMSDTMSFTRGQFVLEAFTFHEGTDAAAGFMAAAQNVWPDPTTDLNVHRFTIMITDGMANGVVRQGMITSVMTQRQTSLFVLQISDAVVRTHGLDGLISAVESIQHANAVQAGEVCVVVAQGPQNLDRDIHNLVRHVFQSVQHRCSHGGKDGPAGASNAHWFAVAELNDRMRGDGVRIAESLKNLKPIALKEAQDAGGAGKSYRSDVAFTSPPGAPLPFHKELVEAKLRHSVTEEGAIRQALPAHIAAVRYAEERLFWSWILMCSDGQGVEEGAPFTARARAAASVSDRRLGSGRASFAHDY